MAIILGTRLVKDTETYNDYAIGITLPIQIFINITNKEV